MIASRLWPLVLMTAAAQAATLPLKPGTYVLATVPCNDPPFAATFDYDGRHFSYPHATHCSSAIVSRDDRLYRVRETCSALGDGSPTAASTVVTSYRILSRDRVDVRQAKETDYSTYRWCLSASAKRVS
jgi:hypothetical protein